MTRIEAEYSILTLKILFGFRTGRISHFDIQNPILTFELKPNIVFWHSKSFYDIRTGRISHFDIRTEAEYRILPFEIFFWHSNWVRISNFIIQNPILTFELKPNIVFWHSKSFYDIRTGRVSHFDIRTEAEYRILTFKVLFWYSNWGRISNLWHSNGGGISNFYNGNPIFTLELS